MTDTEIVQSITGGLQALVDGEVVNIRLHPSFTDSEVQECMKLFEQKVGLPIKRVEVAGLLSRSFHCWIGETSE